MIRVLLAEDMRILRDTLVSVLNLEDDIKVVAQVAAGTDIVPAALAERPDLAVLDIDLPGLDGISAAAQLHVRLPRVGRDPDRARASRAAARGARCSCLGLHGQARAVDQLIDVFAGSRRGPGERPKAGPGCA